MSSDQKQEIPQKQTYQLPALQRSTSSISSNQVAIRINETKKTPINVPEGFTGRSYGEAIYTDEINTCRIYVIFGERDGKACFSLTHANSFTSVRQIKDEFEWAGKEAKITLIQHPESPLDLGTKNLASIPLTETFDLPKECNILCASISDERKLSLSFSHTENKRDFALRNHPEALKIYSIHLFNCAIGSLYASMSTRSLRGKESKRESSDVIQNFLSLYSPKDTLLFDGQDFRPLNSHDLIHQAKITYDLLATEFPPFKNFNILTVGRAIKKILKHDAEKIGTPLNAYFGSPDVQHSISSAIVWFCYIRDPNTSVIEYDFGNPHFLQGANTARRYSNKEEIEASAARTIAESYAMHNALQVINRQHVKELIPSANTVIKFVCLAAFFYYFLNKAELPTYSNVVLAMAASGAILRLCAPKNPTITQHTENQLTPKHKSL